MDIDLEDYFDADERDGEDPDGAVEDLFEDQSEHGRSNGDDNSTDRQHTADSKPVDEVDVDVTGASGHKKRVVRPRPKLNVDRLLGPRGLSRLVDSLSSLPLKGRGHERSDLRSLMSGLEHWCYRLFPSEPFDSVLERLEKLGRTREMQVNIKKMRMGMEVCATRRDDSVTGDGDPSADGNAAHDSVDVFDELIARTAASQAMSSAVTLDRDSISPTRRRSQSDAANDELDDGSDSVSAATTLFSPNPAPESNSLSKTITVEQRDRINRNRELAQIRRMRAKFGSRNSEQDGISGCAAENDDRETIAGDASIDSARLNIEERGEVDPNSPPPLVSVANSAAYNNDSAGKRGSPDSESVMVSPSFPECNADSI